MSIQKVGRVLVSVLAGFVTSLAVGCLVLVGGVWVALTVEISRYGRQEVYDAPGHDAAVVFLVFPFACIAAFLTLVLFTLRLYRKLSGNSHASRP